MFSFKKAGPVEWLVVGLGNPGPKYEWTRHNVGFLVVDELAERASIPVQKLKYKALTNTTVIGGQSVLLMKPTTYMNLSGESVGQAARFYKIPPERVLVISDDVALPQGKLRIRRSGSAGGHNGLKNIIAHLGTDQFPPAEGGGGGQTLPRQRHGRLGPGQVHRPGQGRHGAGHRQGRRRGGLPVGAWHRSGHGQIQLTLVGGFLDRRPGGTQVRPGGLCRGRQVVPSGTVAGPDLRRGFPPGPGRGSRLSLEKARTQRVAGEGPRPPFFYGPLAAARSFWGRVPHCSGRWAITVPIYVP